MTWAEEFREQFNVPGIGSRHPLVLWFVDYMTNFKVGSGRKDRCKCRIWKSVNAPMCWQCHLGARRSPKAGGLASSQCPCGQVKERGKKSCIACRKPAGRRPVVLPPTPCVTCGRVFQPKTRTSKACKPECGWAYIADLQRSRRLPDTSKRENVRRHRRKASTLRRARGWKAVKGRWQTICARDGWVCWVCLKPIDQALRCPNRWAGTVDHVAPLSRGGTDDDDNLRAAHFSCNSRRGQGRFAVAQT